MKNKVGNKFYSELEFENGKIFTNENGKCSYDFNYPLYSITYNLDFKKSGFKLFSLAFLMDNNGKIIDQMEFPKVKPNSEKFELISIEKFNEILKKRKISSENLFTEFNLDKKENSFFWYAKSWLSGGMASGQGCSATYKYHFKVNAITGELTEYNNEKGFY